MHGLGLVATWLGERLQDPNLHGSLVTLLGLVFLVSGTAKLRRPQLAAVALVNFRVVRTPSAALGVGLGVAEATLGLCLIGRVASDVVLVVSATLLLFFAYASLRLLNAGAAFPCFCFGESDEPISGRTVLRAALLGGLALCLAAAATLHDHSWWPLWPLQLSFATAILLALLLAGEIPGLLRASRHPAHGRA